jgi:MFS family permease
VGKLKKRIKMFKYFLAYLFIGLAVGSYLPILASYLKNDLSFDGSKVGTITAVTILVSIVTLPIWGLITDKIKSPKKTLLMSLVLSSILIAMVSMVSSFIGFLIFISIFMVFRAPVFGLYDEILIEVCKNNQINYGTMRIGGSLGYASSLLIGTVFTRIYGNHVLFLLSALFFLIVATFILLTEDVGYQHKETIHIKVDIPILLRNQTFMAIIAVYAITFGLLDANMTYMSTYLREFSGGDDYISIAVFLSSIIELPILYSTRFIYKRFNIKQLFLFVNMINILRYVLMFLFPTTMVVLILAPLHGITFGLGYPIIIQFIKDHVKGHVLATAYTIFNALLALMTAVFNLISGILLDVLNDKIHYLFILYFSVYALNIVFICIVLKNQQYKASTV